MNIIDNIALLIIKPIIVLLVALAVLYFVYGLLKFIMNQDNATAQEEGKRHMFWGVFGVAVMISVSVFLNLITNTLSNLQ